MTQNQRAVLAKVKEYVALGCWPGGWPSHDGRKVQGLLRTLWSLQRKGLVEITKGPNWTIEMTNKGEESLAKVL